MSLLTNFILYISTANSSESFILIVLMHQNVDYKSANFHSNRPSFASTQACNLRRQESTATRIWCIALQRKFCFCPLSLNGAPDRAQISMYVSIDPGLQYAPYGIIHNVQIRRWRGPIPANGPCTRPGCRKFLTLHKTRHTDPKLTKISPYIVIDLGYTCANS